MFIHYMLIVSLISAITWIWTSDLRLHLAAEMRMLTDSWKSCFFVNKFGATRNVIRRSLRILCKVLVKIVNSMALQLNFKPFIATASSSMPSSCDKLFGNSQSLSVSVSIFNDSDVHFKIFSDRFEVFCRISKNFEKSSKCDRVNILNFVVFVEK